MFQNILLQHDLGYQKKKHRLLGKEVFPNEYPPARTYYNVRNGMVLHRLYPESLNLKAHLRYHLYKRIVFVLLYEKQKIAKWKALGTAIVTENAVNWESVGNRYSYILNLKRNNRHVTEISYYRY